MKTGVSELVRTALSRRPLQLSADSNVLPGRCTGRVPSVQTELELDLWNSFLHQGKLCSYHSFRNFVAVLIFALRALPFADPSQYKRSFLGKSLHSFFSRPGTELSTLVYFPQK